MWVSFKFNCSSAQPDDQAEPNDAVANRRTFRREVGVPISRYRNSMRLGRFWEVYRGARDISMLDAALAAGFGCYAQFFRVYTDAYGKGPREAIR